MNLLFLVDFNNYLNRRILKYSTPDDYDANSGDYFYKNDVDFNPNDGVNTTFIVNQSDNYQPDYMIAFDNENNIISRWFVTEYKRLRGGQWRATLRRDVVADNLDRILFATTFIERGPLGYGNPLVYNSEGMSLNQIKKEQTLLKDETQSAWIVGYINRDTNKETEISSIRVEDEIPELTALGIQLTDIADPTRGGTFQFINEDLFVNMNIRQETAVDGRYRFIYTNYPVLKRANPYAYNSDRSGYSMTIDRGYQSGDVLNTFSSVLEFSTTIRSNALTVLATRQPNCFYLQEDLNLFLQTVSKKVIYNNKYYMMQIVGNPSEINDYVTVSPSSFPAVYNDIKNAAQATARGLGIQYTETGTPYAVNIRTLRYRVAFSEVSGPASIKTHIPNSRRHLEDSPLDMFALKFNLDNLSLAQQIAIHLGADAKDIQILPYFPARDYLDPSGEFKPTLLKNREYSEILNGDDEVVDKMYFATRSSGSFYINTPIAIKRRTDDEVLNIKMSNDVDKYRLVSPNYNSAFEFSVAKNGGVDSFRVDFTYRPFSPYIHVAPRWSNLYGSDTFNDARGLICNGDFSIDMISDAWENYQIQNKNYQNIFNTQIKSMDIQHKYDMASGGIGAITGAAGVGVGLGIMTGNPAIGAAAGITSLGGGIADQFINENRYQEMRQIQIDQFNFQLGNVKALPDTLTKVSAYNINNQYFPFVEYYTCTELEEYYYINKIKYQSYLLGFIGTIKELTDSVGTPFDGETFVKGQIIRIGLEDDFHLATEIYNEIYKGVYL